ncbi:MAG: VOC family protein [Campylobacterales bacterium]|nr:VOC family protein [Campylobacterales bacterium]NQY21567.1 VOC family protein [Campylobacteraceae bacterium]NQY52599.1 VOC family protein [Campylobacteraceae bacterium]
MKINKIHHVAYRCSDAKKTVLWYKEHFNMDFVLAIAENEVPSTKQPDPYMHIFLDAGAGNILAFFEIPTFPKAIKDPNTPDWVQHIAFEISSMEELNETKEKWVKAGLDVVGPTNHGLFKSIYVFDPDGHRLELSVNVGSKEEIASQMKKMDEVKWAMLEEWSITKRAPEHAKWLHAEEFGDK